jgi:hypothetical protein
MEGVEELLGQLPDAPPRYDAVVAGASGRMLPAGQERPGRPDEGGGGATMPPWRHARQQQPPGPAQPPALAGGDGGPAPLPPGSVKVAAAGVVPIGFSLEGHGTRAGAAPQPDRTAAVRPPGRADPKPSAPAKPRSPQELQDRAARIETDLRSTTEKMDRLRLRQTGPGVTRQDYDALGREIDQLDVQRKALSREYLEIRKDVPYPPALDLETAEQLQLRAEALRAALAANDLKLGEIPGWRQTPEKIDLTLEQDSLRRQYSDIAEALVTKAENARTERDRISLSGSALSGWQRRCPISGWRRTSPCRRTSCWCPTRPRWPGSSWCPTRPPRSVPTMGGTRSSAGATWSRPPTAASSPEASRADREGRDALLRGVHPQRRRRRDGGRSPGP